MCALLKDKAAEFFQPLQLLQQGVAWLGAGAEKMVWYDFILKVAKKKHL